MKLRDGNVVERVFEATFDFVDRRAITRRVMTLGTFGITIHVIEWSLRFAETSPRPGTEIAAILLAINTPLGALMGYMFGQYVQSTPAVVAPPPAPPTAVSVQVTQ